MAFCLDSNVFIEAHQKRYPMDLVPGFWDSLLVAANAKSIFSIEEVYKELAASGDEVSIWAKTNHDAIFCPNDDLATQQALTKVHAAIDARSPAYTPVAKTGFYKGADTWLIAYCLAHGHVLVTEEISKPLKLTKVSIPDIARPLGVKTVQMLPMLRDLKLRLISG